MKTTKKFTPSILNPKPLAYAVALAMLQAGAAWAADGVEVEKVVVTANKRAQSLQDVPAALTVLSDSVLQRENVKGIDDLPLLAPAVTVSYGTQPGNFSINMRGVGTYSLGIGVESDVSVIVDDIPYALQASAFKDMTDVFRVEVLKGPQSTLFGLLTYRNEESLRHGRIFVVDNFLTFELNRAAPGRQALCEAAEALARKQGCNAIELRLDSRGYAIDASAKARSWLNLGHRLEAVVFTKILDAVNATDGGEARLSAATI